MHGQGMQFCPQGPLSSVGCHPQQDSMDPGVRTALCRKAGAGFLELLLLSLAHTVGDRPGVKVIWKALPTSSSSSHSLLFHLFSVLQLFLCGVLVLHSPPLLSHRYTQPSPPHLPAPLPRPPIASLLDSDTQTRQSSQLPHHAQFKPELILSTCPLLRKRA